MSVTSIQEEILGLPAMERARLIDLLWDSLAEPGQPARESAWAAESERRIDAYAASRLSARNAHHVLTELKKGLRR